MPSTTNKSIRDFPTIALREQAAIRHQTGIFDDAVRVYDVESPSVLPHAIYRTNFWRGFLRRSGTFEDVFNTFHAGNVEEDLVVEFVGEVMAHPATQMGASGSFEPGKDGFVRFSPIS